MRRREKGVRHILQYVTWGEMKRREFRDVCRKLANEERVDVLRRVMISSEEGLSVGQVADMVRLEQPATSVYLAQLERDCGLVAAKREGRYCVYRAEPDKSDGRIAAIFDALRTFFRAESSRFVFVNGERPDTPAFVSVLPALANETRVRLLGYIRRERHTDKGNTMKSSGLTEVNVRRHVACLAECGLVEVNGCAYTWREPSDAVSRLFIELSLQ